MCLEHLVHMPLFAVDPKFSKQQEWPQRWAAVQSTKNCHEREWHLAGEACYSRWPTYLNSGNTLNLWPFTWYKSPNYARRTRYEKKGVCKMGTPLPGRGTKMERVRCATQMLAVFEPQGPKPTDWCCHRRWNLHKLLWRVLKTGNYGVDRWSRGQTSRPQTWISEQEAALHYISNHAGPLVVNIRPENTTTTNRHSTGTVLPNVIVAVQEQRLNVGITRTLLLHDNAAPHKARATI